MFGDGFLLLAIVILLFIAWKVWTTNEYAEIRQSRCGGGYDLVYYDGKKYNLDELVNALRRGPVERPFFQNGGLGGKKEAENRQKLAVALGLSLIFFEKQKTSGNSVDNIVEKKKCLVFYSQESGLGRKIILPLKYRLYK